jgi:hypothetical protein
MKQLEAKGHKVQLVSDAAPKKVEAEEDPDFEPTVIEDFDEPLSDSEVKPKKRDDSPKSAEKSAENSAEKSPKMA